MFLTISSQEELDNLSSKYNLNEIKVLGCDNNVSDISITLKMTNLQILQVSNTNVSKIPQLDNLECLWCDNNNVSKIPQLDNLVELHCENINISKIPSLKNLRYLYCKGSNVKEFKDIGYLPKLKEFLFNEPLQSFFNL